MFLLQACSSNHEKNIGELDELYGECDNPANSALRTGSNWGVTYDIDQIPMVEIFVNTPLSNGLKS